MSKIMQAAFVASLIVSGIATHANAQTSIVEQAVPQRVDVTNVVRAKHIKPGDVSPEEYQSLLLEAEKIKLYQEDMANKLSHGSVYIETHPPQSEAEYVILSDSTSRTVNPPAIQTVNPPAMQTVNPPAMQTVNPPAIQQALIETEGTALILPASTTSAPVHTNVSVVSISNQYNVVKGDTLYSIARRHGISLNDLKSANGIKSNTLSIGQTLKIPAEEIISYRSVASQTTSPKVTAASESQVNPPNRVIRALEVVPTDVYAVLPGDTVYSISKRACVSVNDVAKVNTLGDESQIEPGQRLTLPNGHCLK